MKTLPIILAVAVSLALGVEQSQAQQRRPGGPEGPGREGGMMRMNPLVIALDTNGDGVIDEKEIANASAALKKLDKNGDGKLTEDELRPAMNRPGGAGAAASEEMVKRLMEFDKNGDGKLSKEELPERMQAMFERGDTDHDGFLSKDEVKKMAETRGGGPGGQGREGGERRQQPPAGDK